LKAADVVDPEIVRTLLNCAFSADKKREMTYLHSALRTLDLEVFEPLLNAIDQRRNSRNRFLSESEIEHLFKLSVWEGWTAMAIYLLDRGAPINSCRENNIGRSIYRL
jgi:ribosomal 50S subunit-associated protein YjgA (DUF615 family)